VALAHDDSVERAGIARHLVQAQCDVLLVDTFSALAALDDDFPPVAVVHLGLPHMEHLLQGMLGKRSELRVVGVLTNADRVPAQRRLEAAGVQYFQLAAPDARPADLAQLVRRLASW
jgi:hypothetical protein